MEQLSLVLTIGQVSVRVRSENKTFYHDLNCYYSNFIDQDPCDVAAEIILTHQALPFKEDIVVMCEHDVYVVDGGEFKGEFNLKSKKAHFMMNAQVSFFDSFLRVFYSLILTSHNSFLVHAAGLTKDGWAYLFAGPSDSGKTTTATIADGFTVLNDELVLAKRIGDKFFLHATPFNGDYDQAIVNSSAPLKGFYFLDKQLTRGYEPVGKAQSLVQILESVFFFDANLKPNQLILNLCHQLVTQYDSYKINILSHQHLRGLINEISKEHSYT